MTAEASPFDPTNIAHLRECLTATLSERFADITVAHGPDPFSGGMDTYVYAIRFTGKLPPEWLRPLVLRIYPTTAQAEKAQREAAVQSFVASRGFPAPDALLVDPAGGSLGLPFMIMEHVDGAQAIEAIKNPMKLPGMIRGMAALQAGLHTLPTDGCPLPYESPLVDRLLEEPREQITRFGLSGLAPVLDRLQANAGLVRDETPSLVHLDFHPLNILAEGKRMTLIDWSDAALGDRHADVARTLAILWLAAPLLENPIERTLLSILRCYLVPAYRRAYRAHLPLDDARLRYWEALHGLRSWAQITVLKQEGEGALGARPGVASEIPAGVIPALRKYVMQRVRALG